MKICLKKLMTEKFISSQYNDNNHKFITCFHIINTL